MEWGTAGLHGSEQVADINRNARPTFVGFVGKNEVDRFDPASDKRAHRIGVGINQAFRRLNGSIFISVSIPNAEWTLRSGGRSAFGGQSGKTFARSELRGFNPKDNSEASLDLPTDLGHRPRDGSVVSSLIA